MMTVAARGTRHNNRFDVVANAFRQKEGLAFAEVLSAERIKQAFQEENGLFGQDDLFSTDIVLWAFLAQTLRDGIGDRCSLGSQEPFCRFHSQPPGQVSVAFMDDGLGFAGGECRGLGGHQVEDPASVLQLVPLMEFRVV